MPFKIFYAWQSDRANNLCRGLIRKALDDAAKTLNRDLEIEDVVRQITIDQDTQGVAGSPSVAETILAKIRDCDVFVADLTFIPTGDGCRPSPNPNVLIEYGYALHAISDQRIIGVLNNAFGSVDDLPFDLRHKRWPLQFHAENSGDGEESQTQRRLARKELTCHLTEAIEAVFRAYAEAPATAPDSPATVEALASSVAQPESAHATVPPAGSTPTATPTSSIFKYPWDDDVVGTREERDSDGNVRQVRLIDGPSIFLRVTSSGGGGHHLSNVETMRVLRESVRPMAWHRATGWDAVRSRYGATVFTPLGEDPDIAATAGMLTRNNELHGIDRYHLQPHRFRSEEHSPYIPTAAIEEILIDGLLNFVDVAHNRLGLSPPFEIAAGVEGVTGYQLAVDPKFFAYDKFVGHIFHDSIARSESIKSVEFDPFDVLEPLFQNIYDEAGVERPRVRSVGRSQR
jgi:hypothetical protein